jgi:hypothetical protein
MKTAKPNRYVKKQPGGITKNWAVAGLFGAAVAVVGLLLLFVYLNAAGLEAEHSRGAQLAKEVAWLKTRVANLEGYTAHLEAKLEGLEVFDCVFTGDQAETSRANYNRAINQAFERIAKGHGD